MPAVPEHRPATRVIDVGREANGTSLNPPIWPTAVWESADLDDAHRDAITIRSGTFYGRYGNPTVRAFEQAVADLEAAGEPDIDALAFGSGMGAVATTVLALCSAGSHVVAARQIYSGTLAFLQGPAARLGIETTFVDSTVPGALADAVQPGRTMLVIAETPSNPRLELVDLDELGSIMGPFTVVDSTFATPLGQNPLAHGVDLVLHSATKGISGHNDVTLGVVVGESDLIAELWSYGVLHGATASPYDAHNALRGIRTLHVRLAHQAATAQRLAEALSEHPAVTAVHYPGLTSHPQHDLAKRQMREYGSMLTFEVAGGRDAVAQLFERMSVARCATSLGGPETLLTHPATTTAVSLTPAEKEVAGVTDGLVRVSVGLEDPEDLVADLTSAL
ncbi:MAG TPA: aminotransferase class I/II-fold pyridoxal phosphate-dependent enzyme [Ilumatobacter sp.]|nr:aminotransferase class I/II-fold pyridoxal phosphate-dependent enzyme [Ilumatobacter sp.]